MNIYLRSPNGSPSLFIDDTLYYLNNLRSLKGLPDTIKVMTTNYKQVFGLALGLTGIVSSGVILSKTPDIIIAQMQEQTKIIQEQTNIIQEEMKQITSQEETKFMQEQTKQVILQEQTKQLQEQTKQMELKNRRKWFLF